MTIIRKIAECVGFTLVSIALAFALVIVGCAVLLAHDDAQWIMDQQLRNKAGEWCCGRGDCEPIDKDGYTVTPRGYRLTASEEVIAFSETSPLSIDGRLWVCRRPDGTRRCVFDGPAGS